MSKQTIKRAALYSTVMIVLMVLIFPYILERIVNYSQVKYKVSSFLEQRIGAKIDPDRIDFIFFPQPGIRIKKVAISFNQIFKLDIGAVNIDINLYALLKGKLAASKIFIETPHIGYLRSEERRVGKEC